jgi:hypothetical protein
MGIIVFVELTNILGRLTFSEIYQFLFPTGLGFSKARDGPPCPLN